MNPPSQTTSGLGRNRSGAYPRHCSFQVSTPEVFLLAVKDLITPLTPPTPQACSRSFLLVHLVSELYKCTASGIFIFYGCAILLQVCFLSCPANQLQDAEIEVSRLFQIQAMKNMAQKRNTKNREDVAMVGKWTTGTIPT